jgi:isocitrate/isopropylmalate dehydrogenase
VRLAVIPGDGIGPEVTAEALKVLEQAVLGHAGGRKVESTSYDLGAGRQRALLRLSGSGLLRLVGRPNGAAGTS